MQRQCPQHRIRISTISPIFQLALISRSEKRPFSRCLPYWSPLAVATVTSRLQSCHELWLPRIRPHLEHGNCAWGPSSRGDQKQVEKVQRRATKLVPKLRNKPYSQRLKELGLPSLTYRRLRGDMTAIYQIIHGSLDVQPGLLQLSHNRNTRGHHLKLHKPRASSRARRNFLSVRAVNSWIGLPSHVISAPSINAFKSRLDSHWQNIHFLSVFDQ